MKKLLIFAAAATTLALTSCYVDPYYGGGGSVDYGGSAGYSSYGGGGYSSSVFVSTGDPRWSYDPYRYCYYDRTRNSYYDPYLYGYYPVGYLPTPVVGCPHPGNWSGRGYCPPPSNIRVRNLSQYDKRVSNYAAADYHWARKVSGSGSGSWMNQTQRTQLQQRASQPQAPNSGRGGFQGGSNQSGAPRVTPSRSGSGLPGWSGSAAPQVRERSQPRTFVTTPPAQIQPRNSGGGIFGNMDRSRTVAPRVEPSRSFNTAPRVQAPRTLMPRVEAPRVQAPRQIQQAPPQQAPRAPQNFDSGGSKRDRSDDTNNSGAGGGLRRFQR